jgi:hypothetical protein
MPVRIQIADTYKRKVKIELPGSGTEPEEHTITVIYRDLDPEEIQTDEERLRTFMQTLYGLMDQLKQGKQDPEKIEAARSDLQSAEDITPHIDKILVGVEGLEVVGRDGELLEGDALVSFCKRYPRIRQPILKAYADENRDGTSASLGNLLKSARPGPG